MHEAQTSSRQAAGGTASVRRIPIQGAGAVYTKVPLFDNSEVKLRKLKTPCSHAALEDQHVTVTSSRLSPIWKRKAKQQAVYVPPPTLPTHAPVEQRLSNDRLSVASGNSSDVTIDRQSSTSSIERSRERLSSHSSDTASLCSSQDGVSYAGSRFSGELPPHLRTAPDGDAAGACGCASGDVIVPQNAQSLSTLPRISDRQRKRAYRIGLNLFNK